MPAKPYFHGDEDFYALHGALIAHCPSYSNVHGLMTVEFAKVLTLDRRYSLAMWMPGGGCVWRTARGDQMDGASLEQVVARCHEVFGANPRYRLGAQ